MTHEQKTQAYVAVIPMSEHYPQMRYQFQIGLPRQVGSHDLLAKLQRPYSTFFGEALVRNWGVGNDAQTHRVRTSMESYATREEALQTGFKLLVTEFYTSPVSILVRPHNQLVQFLDFGPVAGGVNQPFIAAHFSYETLPDLNWLAMVGLPCNEKGHVTPFFRTEKPLFGEAVESRWGITNRSLTHRIRCEQRTFNFSTAAEALAHARDRMRELYVPLPTLPDVGQWIHFVTI